jgi:uncharacterized surface protein with fasciclin (FAS1) repeats
MFGSIKTHCMKKIILSLTLLALLAGCNTGQNETTATNDTESGTQGGGQSAVVDDQSQKDVVKVAIGSKDHTTLVTAIKTAEYVDVLSNAGPFTVFAPTNAAFDKLPAGTVDGLLKPESKDALRNILEYHVTTSSLKEEYFTDGMTIGMVNGGNIKVTKGADGKLQVNGANVIGAVAAANGMVYIIDGVLLPNSK